MWRAIPEKKPKSGVKIAVIIVGIIIGFLLLGFSAPYWVSPSESPFSAKFGYSGFFSAIFTLTPGAALRASSWTALNTQFAQGGSLLASTLSAYPRSRGLDLLFTIDDRTAGSSGLLDLYVAVDMDVQPLLSSTFSPFKFKNIPVRVKFSGDISQGATCHGSLILRQNQPLGYDHPSVFEYEVVVRSVADSTPDFLAQSSRFTEFTQFQPIVPEIQCTASRDNPYRVNIHIDQGDTFLLTRPNAGAQLAEGLFRVCWVITLILCLVLG